jgi:molybdopterin-containing oxidoreductase family iron-sulfur binding subunit
VSHGLHSHDHDDGPDRRDVLKLLGFSLGAATLASCTPIPERRALPLLSQPEGVLPGVETWYATACRGCSAGCGLLVKTRDGRPIKIEGNPDSFSGGGTCAVGQAAVLSLYDDQRLRGPLLHGRPAPWPEVDAFVRQRLEAVASHRGGIVLLTGTIASPSTRALIAGWQARFPGTHVVYDPVSLAALRQANGVLPHYHFDRARFVAGLEADFLGTWLSPVEFARAYVRARKQPDGLRHVQIESGLSLTGSNADRRIAVHPSELGLAALALLQRVAARAGSPLNLPPVQPPCDPCDPQRLDALADDLWRHQGESLVVCGLNDLSAQLAVHRINALLGNIGTTIDLDHPSWQRQGDDAAMAALLDDMERGAVHALVVWGANPAYDHPQADRFVRALANVSLKVSLADRLDETAVHADVVCPDHHFLESWGDGEPVAGRLTLMQPTIAPLFDTRAAHQTLLTWMGQPSDPLADLRERWRREVFPRQDRWGRFEDFWEHALEAGGWALTPDPSPGLSDRTDRSDRSDRSDLTGRERGAGGEGLFEVLLHETVALRDGRHANNPWLQELPDPVARTAWGNHVAVAPQLAAELGVEDGDVVALQRGENRLELPVLVQPGLPPRSVAVALGYGRTGAGKAGNGVGANAWPFVTVRDGFTQAFATGVQIEKTGRRETLAQTQTHSSMEGRPIVRETTLAALSQPGAEREADQSLWEERPAEGHSWGMVIDLDSCLGCAACVVSCQAENNIAVVGRDEIARGREMHWLRIDRYFNGPQDDPETVYQPMMCQHCANAPCETVCPVLATVHSSDGLNQQVYNRCVGTRYCANNCPYKVRRFNWFNYAGNDRFDFAMNSDLGRMVLNPDVVVRTRGVMEKCSLCIQRIQAGKLRAEADGVPLQDGAIRTACQQACPSEAITFGDAHDPASEVSRLRASPRFYRVLDELNTRPAVGYLARLRREA